MISNAYFYVQQITVQFCRCFFFKMICNNYFCIVNFVLNYSMYKD